MPVLFICLITWQLACDSPSGKVQQQAQPKTSNQNSASTTDVHSDGTVEVVSEAVDPSAAVDPTGMPRSLFDGNSMAGWEKIEFGGEGDIEVVDGEIRMYAGDPLTGISVTEDVELPTANYEFSLEAMKLEGTDFFCAVTFPVNDTFCTLVVGGWGGQLVGLSNLDGQDASSNQTRQLRKFEKNRWYAIKLKVLEDRITAWIDDEKLVDESIEGVEVSIRGDMTTTTPLGITNFMTSSSIRNIGIRKLD